MEIGVAEPIEEEAPRKPKRVRSSGSGQNAVLAETTVEAAADDNGGGPSGGGGYQEPRSDEGLTETPPDKSKVVAWFLLLVVTMTFGGLIGAYVVVFTNNVAEWRPFALPIQVWISTVIIIFRVSCTASLNTRSKRMITGSFESI
jgi:hypothetical protein